MEQNYSREELLQLLLRRTERYGKFLEMQAPNIVINNEIRLIKGACDELLKDIKFENNTVELQ